jgi:small conductance mechanosensitive channel
MSAFLPGSIASTAVAHVTFASTASDWFEVHGGDILTAALILVVAVIANFLVRRSIRLAVDRLVKASEARREKAEREDTGGLPQKSAERLRAATLQRERAEQRTRTVGSLLRYVATITIYTIAVLMALSELGIDIAPLIASAGIAGVALGFGAQSLVKDFLSGVFMLMEDQFGVGDVVDLGEASGTVERVTLRVTTVRGTDGTVWYVPNGQIVRVGNQSQRWSRTVLDVEVAYDTDIDRASAVIKRVADGFWKEQMAGATVIEEPELWGVQNVSPVAVVLRLAVKTRPGEQWAAGRALRARLKTAFDEAGIAAPPAVPTMWPPGGPSGGAGAPTDQGGAPT